jgi:hypothetical protein
VPLEAVLRGIDEAFDKHEARAARGKGRLRKVNGLAWAAQSVMLAAEAAVEASTGLPVARKTREQESGFELERVAAYLEGNAKAIDVSGADAATAGRLRELAAEVRAGEMGLEDLDRTLTVLEEKMLVSLFAAAPEDELTGLKEQAARELAPYRGKMQAMQIKQVQQQFLQKRLLEARGLSRLSLFYMSHG